MITQNVRPKKLSPLEGILLILAIIAGLFAATLASNWLATRGQGLWGQVGVWLLTGLCAYFLMRSTTGQYQYTISNDQFYIERIFGQRGQVMLQLALSDVLMMGAEMEVAKQYPDTRIMTNATISSHEMPVQFMAYRQGKNVHLAKIQPNEELLERLKAGPQPAEDASEDAAPIKNSSTK